MSVCTNVCMYILSSWRIYGWKGHLWPFRARWHFRSSIHGGGSCMNEWSNSAKQEHVCLISLSTRFLGTDDVRMCHKWPTIDPSHRPLILYYNCYNVDYVVSYMCMISIFYLSQHRSMLHFHFSCIPCSSMSQVVNALLIANYCPRLAG
jgi:hypothetical protein